VQRESPVEQPAATTPAIAKTNGDNGEGRGALVLIARAAWTEERGQSNEEPLRLTFAAHHRAGLRAPQERAALRAWAIEDAARDRLETISASVTPP
jgi:hypothetical protein